MTAPERDVIDVVASGCADVGVAHSSGDFPLAIPDHLATISPADDVANVVLHTRHSLATVRGSVRATWSMRPGSRRLKTRSALSGCPRWIREQGGNPLIAHESMEFQSHLALVRAGLGIALVPRLGREDLTDDLFALRTHDPVPTGDIVAVHRRSMADSPCSAGRGCDAGFRDAGGPRA